MAVFRVQVNYTFGASGKWSNVWHISAPTIGEAQIAFESFGVPDLLPMLSNDCLLASFLISDELSTEFITVPVNAAGTSAEPGELLPLFNSAKVLFTDGSLGRPDYKFIKGYLTEGSQADGVIEPATITSLTALMSTLIADLDGDGEPLVSADNDQYLNASVQPAVQMRQMHRRRRRTAPAP